MQQARTSFLSGIPNVCKNILIINIIVWLAQMVLMQRGIDLSDHLGLTIFDAQFRIYQFVTHVFTWPLFWHVFFKYVCSFHVWADCWANMGSKRFLTYYFITGIGVINSNVSNYTVSILLSGLRRLHLWCYCLWGQCRTNMNYTDAWRVHSIYYWIRYNWYREQVWYILHLNVI